ncbi:MAG: 23S rRNA (pseudouridine(1915)-N(3))-methyltransferase RlmH [Selenomonadaceae bacterium]|nr:23S rRNA (pseudouridine(1915)-N(3))-methyltransferase RlmH [Selenomonadaceae bacterium]MBR1728795.1 23S rRNA (pseudouridine(1915)-N(3))-methyltransferase RlmH [Selenomonadaceae bacterium]
MKINILTIGKLKEKYLIDALNEYRKRLKNFCTLEIIELLEQRTIDLEGEMLLKRISPESFKIILDIHGKEISSEEFAKKISDLALNGQSNLTFVIGGAFGISEELRQAADFKLSLSKMTFTHQMTRLILIEQIYRSFKIIHNEPYHW